MVFRNIQGSSKLLINLQVHWQSKRHNQKIKNRNKIFRIHEILILTYIIKSFVSFLLTVNKFRSLQMQLIELVLTNNNNFTMKQINICMISFKKINLASKNFETDAFAKNNLQHAIFPFIPNNIHKNTQKHLFDKSNLL